MESEGDDERSWPNHLMTLDEWEALPESELLRLDLGTVTLEVADHPDTLDPAHPPLTQAITADLLTDAPWSDGYLHRVRAATAERARAFTGAVAELLQQVSCSTPAGGMFCWLEFPAAIDITRLLPRALEHGVGFGPGSAFAVDTALPSAARCCFASVLPGDLREAVQRLACASTVGGAT